MQSTAKGTLYRFQNGQINTHCFTDVVIFLQQTPLFIQHPAVAALGFELTTFYAIGQSLIH